jgi:peptide/nickel transport system ATP-binding protein/oligopeptide transport system ATP-binding protein
VPAVREVSIDIPRGETVAVVGESGAGKSTLGRLVTRLIKPDEGGVVFDGIDLLALSNREMRHMRARIQMIFQDPYSSLDPVMTIGESISEPLKLHTSQSRKQRYESIISLLDRVGMSSDVARRYPRGLSGGQLQRIAIARALATDPSLIICDEPVASLDISIRGQVLSLLVRLQQELGLSYMFISHDLGVVRHLSHRVVVMYGGQVVETGSSQDLFTHPRHPYTRALLDSIPIPNPKLVRHRETVAGELLATPELMVGCPYRTRCPHAIERCETERPELRVIAPGQEAACHRDDVMKSDRELAAESGR